MNERKPFKHFPVGTLQEIGAELARLGVQRLNEQGHERGMTIAIVATPKTFDAPDVASCGINADGVLLVVARVYASMCIDMQRDPVDFARALLAGQVHDNHGDETDAEQAAEVADAELDEDTAALLKRGVDEGNALLARLQREEKAFTKELALGMVSVALGHMRENGFDLHDVLSLNAAVWALTENAKPGEAT